APNGLVEQRHLAEELTSDELGEADRPPAVFAQYLRLAALDDVDPVAEIALAEDFLTRLEVLLGDTRGDVELQLDQLGRQQEIECPRSRHLEPAPPSRELHQVDRSPHPPGEEARDVEAENLGDRRAVPERA